MLKCIQMSQIFCHISYRWDIDRQRSNTRTCDEPDNTSVQDLTCRLTSGVVTPSHVKLGTEIFTFSLSGFALDIKVLLNWKCLTLQCSMCLFASLWLPSPPTTVTCHPQTSLILLHWRLYCSIYCVTGHWHWCVSIGIWFIHTWGPCLA